MALSTNSNQMIDELIENRVLDEHTMPNFLRRIEEAPDHLSQEEKIRQAADNTLRDRLARDVARVPRTFQNIDKAANQMASDIEQKGVLGTGLDIAKSIVTAPIQSVGELASGRSIESPLQTGLGMVGFLPAAWGAAGIGGRVLKGGLGQSLGAVAKSPALRRAATAVDVADVASSEEHMFHELAASGVTQSVGRLAPRQSQTVDPTSSGPLNQQPSQPTQPGQLLLTDQSQPVLQVEDQRPVLQITDQSPSTVVTPPPPIATPPPPAQPNQGYESALFKMGQRQGRVRLRPRPYRVNQLREPNQVIQERLSQPGATTIQPEPTPEPTPSTQSTPQQQPRPEPEPEVTKVSPSSVADRNINEDFGDKMRAESRRRQEAAESAKATPEPTPDPKLTPDQESDRNRFEGRIRYFRHEIKNQTFHLRQAKVSLANMQDVDPNASSMPVFQNNVDKLQGKINALNNQLKTLQERGALPPEELSSPTPQSEPTPEPTPAPDELQRQKHKSTKNKSELQQVRKRLAQQRKAFENATKAEAAPEFLDELELQVVGLEARERALVEETQEIQNESGGGGTTFFSDPFTATAVLGGQMLANAWKSAASYLEQRSATNQATATATGTVNTNVVTDRIVNPEASNVTGRVRIGARRIRETFSAGITSIKRRGGEWQKFLGDMQQHLQLDPQRKIAIDDSRLMPHVQSIEKMVKSRMGNQSAKIVRSNYHAQVWDFIESNKLIENDPELQQVAVEMKEVVRQLNLETALSYMELRDKLESEHSEGLYVQDSYGEKHPWRALLPDHTWDDNRRLFIRDSDSAELTIEQAIGQADKLYMPRHYPQEFWVRELERSKERLESLGKSYSKGKLTGFTSNENGSFTRDRDGLEFPNIQSAYQTERSFLQDRVNDMVVKVDISAPGFNDAWGHLERMRETNDPSYTKDLALLVADRRKVWQRYGEILFFGQQDQQSGYHQRLDKMVTDFMNAPTTDFERAILPIAQHLMQYDKFQRLPGIKQEDRNAAYIVNSWNVDVERIKSELPNIDVDYLTRIGLFKSNQNGTHSLGDSQQVANILGKYNAFKANNKAVIESVVEGMTHWNKPNPAEMEHGKFWQSVNNATTIFTLNPFTAVRNIPEIGLLSTLTGPGNLAKALKSFAADPDVRQYGMRMMSAWNPAVRYLAQGSNLQQKYLGAIGYTGIEQISRGIGHIAGMEAGRDAIRRYITDTGDINRDALSRLHIDSASIDAYMNDYGISSNTLETLFKESQQRDFEGQSNVEGQVNPDAPDASNIHVDKIGNELNRAGRFVSDQTFKEYNRLSLPDFLADTNPILRTFFKFKAWAAQMHRFIWDNIKISVKEGRRGNYRPAMNMVAAFATMGLGATAVRGLFDWMAGREEPEGFSGKGLLTGLASSGALGIASIIFDNAKYADGNPYKAYQTLLSIAAGPAFAVGAQVAAPALAGEPGGVVREAAKVAPVTREAYRIRGLFGQGERNREQNE